MANPFESAGFAPAKENKQEKTGANPFDAAGFESAQKAQSREEMTHKAPFLGGISASEFGGPKEKILYGPQSMEIGYDYYSGVPDSSVRYNLSRADNPAEQKAALEKKFGAGNVFQDKYGNWLVRPEGFKNAGMSVPSKPTAVVPRETDWTSVAGYADYGGAAIPLLGGIAGAAATGGAGLASIVGGATGASGAKWLDEAAKKVQGLHRKTLGETYLEAGEQGLMFGAGDVFGRGLVGAKGIIAKGPSRFATEEQKQAFRQATEKGYMPTVSQAIPGMRLLSREQQMTHRVFSDPALQQNIATLTREMEEFLARTGMPKKDIPEAIDKIVSAATGDETFGKVVVKSMQRARKGMELEARKSREQAGLELSKNLGELQKRMSVLGTDTSQVKAAIVSNYEKFQAQAADSYGQLDQLAGKELIPTSPLKDVARQIRMRRAEAGGVVQDPEVDSLLKRIDSMPEFVTARGMQDIRSRFGEKWFPQGMVKGLGDAERALLYGGADESFSLAIHDMGGRPEQKILEKGLRETDEWYKAQIDKFRNVQVQALVRDAYERGAVDSSQVVDYVIKPGKSEQLGRILQLITPEAKQNLAGAHFKSMISSSTDAGGEVNAKVLRKRINDLGPMLEQIYGKTDAAAIRRHSDMLAALNGHLDPRELGGGSFSQILENALRKEQALDKFMKENYLSELSKGGAESSKAIDFIVQPGHPERAREAIKFFGADSKEAQAIRQGLTQRLFSEMFLEDVGLKPGQGKQLAEYVSGKALKKVMSEYGDSTLEAIYGKDMLADMKKFAERVDYVSRRGGQAGELVSSNLALNWFHKKEKVLMIWVSSKVMANPRFMKYVVLGMDEPTSPAGKAANRAVNAALMEAARGLPFGLTPPFDFRRGEPGMVDRSKGYFSSYFPQTEARQVQ